MATENISTLINNARSRAAVLSSLDNAFETKLSGTHKRPLNEVELSTRIHNDRDTFIDHMQDLLRGSGVYSRQKIEDQIKGKTIVLQHLRSGSTNALAKLKKAHKGQRRVSNGDLKKRQQLSVCTISQEDVAALRGLFAGYMTQIRSGCKNIGQLQARLLTCELTGGTVSIVESVDPSLQQYLGRQGTVLSESKHCLHIAYKVEEADRVKTPKKKRGKKRRRRDPALGSERSVEASAAVKEKEEGEETEEENENEEELRGAENKTSEQKEKCLIVIKVIKEKCRLALSMDAGVDLAASAGYSSGSSSSRSSGRSGSSDGKGDSGLLCILHGKQFLPSLETNFNSLPPVSS